MALLKTGDLAQLAGTSVLYLEKIADAVSNKQLFVTYVYRTGRGGVRRVVRPADPLSTLCKNLHRGLSAELPYRAPEHVHGFVKGRSPLTNAKVHLAKECVLRVDLKEFFPSISTDSVIQALVREGVEEDAAKMLSQICTIDRELPIGLSTSPLLSNLVFLETDNALAQFAERQELSLSRYVDDLAFSGNGVDDDTLTLVSQVLSSHGWNVNERKTAFMRKGGPQYVTGLFVGCEDGPHIPRRIKKELRWVQHIIAKFGYERYMSDFGGEDEGMFPNRLRGWALHVASVEPNFGYSLWRTLDENLPDSGTDFSSARHLKP